MMVVFIELQRTRISTFDNTVTA